MIPKDRGPCQTETQTLGRHQQAGTDLLFGSAPPTSSKLQMVQNLPSDPAQRYLKSSKQLQASLCANSVPTAEAGAPNSIQQWRRLSRVSSTADSSHQSKLTGCLSRSQVVLQSFSSAVSTLFGLHRLTFSLGCFSNKGEHLALGVFPQLPWLGPILNPTQTPLLNLPSPSELSLCERPLFRVGPKAIAFKRLPS